MSVDSSANIFGIDEHPLRGSHERSFDLPCICLYLHDNTVHRCGHDTRIFRLSHLPVLFAKDFSQIWLKKKKKTNLKEKSFFGDRSKFYFIPLPFRSKKEDNQIICSTPSVFIHREVSNPIAILSWNNSETRGGSVVRTGALVCFGLVVSFCNCYFSNNLTRRLHERRSLSAPFKLLVFPAASYRSSGVHWTAWLSIRLYRWYWLYLSSLPLEVNNCQRSIDRRTRTSDERALF